MTVGLMAADAGSTVLTLDHSVTATLVPDSGGALHVGPGWDDAVVALGLHLRGTDLGDPAELQNSPEVLEYNQDVVQAWEATLRESGMATEEQTQAAVAVATAQFTALP